MLKCQPLVHSASYYCCALHQGKLPDDALLSVRREHQYFKKGVWGLSSGLTQVIILLDQLSN